MWETWKGNLCVLQIVLLLPVAQMVIILILLLVVEIEQFPRLNVAYLKKEPLNKRIPQFADYVRLLEMFKMVHKLTHSVGIE